MSAGGLDRLSGEDAEILGLETDAVKGHKASVLVLDADGDGTPLELEELRANIASRLGAEPRARQRVMQTPIGAGLPVWVDYADFDLAEHVLSATGSEGDKSGLRGLTARLLSERLDHSQPMWSIHTLALGGGRTGAQRQGQRRGAQDGTGHAIDLSSWAGMTAPWRQPGATRSRGHSGDMAYRPRGYKAGNAEANPSPGIEADRGALSLTERGRPPISLG